MLRMTWYNKTIPDLFKALQFFLDSQGLVLPNLSPKC